jgi:hypothetical protein
MLTLPRAVLSCFRQASSAEPGEAKPLDALMMTGDRRAILADRVEQFSRGIESIDRVADPFANGHVRGSADPGCGKLATIAGVFSAVVVSRGHP